MTAEVSENPPNSGSVRNYTDGAGRGNKPVHLLVMGPQGCGKSRFINLVTGQNECMTSTTSKLCTKFARSCKNSKWINGYEFRFIDTPGFGNEVIDNRRVFERLVEYFAPNPRDNRYEGPNLPRRVTGLLYIHSEAEPFKDRMSPKAMEMLVKILGEQFLDRVTVLIRSQDKLQVDYSNFTPSKDSPLYPLYCNTVKPWTAAYEEDSQSIHNILDPYIPLRPRLVRLAALDNFAQRDGSNWQYDDIPRHLREFFPEDVGLLTIASQPDLQMRLQEQEGEISRLRDLLANREKEIQDLRSTHDNEVEESRKQRETERSNSELNLKSLYNTIRDQEGQISKLKEENDSELKELETLKEQVRRLESEKELKTKELQDKLEEVNEEVTRLKGDNQRIIQESINAMQAKEREIMQLKSASRSNGATTKANNKQEEEVYRLNEEIHKIKTEYGSLRNHMQLEENVEQADITTALGDINRLIEEFGQSLSEYIENHMKNDSSGTFVSSQTLLSLFGSVGSETPPKIKQDAYLLLEYAVQATICDKLYTHLFKPFHPSIADDEKRDAFITRLYEQMTYQEAQPVAGRWRKDAFNTISKHPSLGNPESFDDKRMHRIITQALSELLGKVFKTLPAEALKEHDRALVKVINKAEELNRLVKGEVSILGDFTPAVFHFGDVFQPDYMYEVSSKPKKTRHPESIMATVGLGIVKRYATGGSRKPEETVLRKAVVFGLAK